MSVDPVLYHEHISVVILDDDPNITNLVSIGIREAGCTVEAYTDSAAFISDVAGGRKRFDILITDLHMPEVDGLEVVRVVRQQLPAASVIVMTGYADKKTAIQAFRLGILDLIEKPFTTRDLYATIKRSIQYQAIEKRFAALNAEGSVLPADELSRWGIQAFVGNSAPFRELISRIRLLHGAGRSRGPVLITGESGTGKELVARAIHFGGSRSSYPFIPVNCSSVPVELAESMFFGHIRGSFTGAVSDRRGAFALAHEGTLFLDEIADMPLSIQAKLLRVMEDGLVQPVGSTETTEVDVRVISATNHDIEKRVASGAFREDLFHRLSGFILHVPPLRERRECIPLLANHFAKAYCLDAGLDGAGLADDAIAALNNYPFPGNIRELKNLVESALIENGCTEIRAKHLRLPGADGKFRRADVARPPSGSTEMPMNLREAELVLIHRALAAANGNYSEAARLLGISRMRLYRKLQQPVTRSKPLSRNVTA